jgi:hypothetical protein
VAGSRPVGHPISRFTSNANRHIYSGELLLSL